MGPTATSNGTAGERTLASIAEAMRASEGASAAPANEREQAKPRGLADLPCPKCGESGDLVLYLSEVPILHCFSCNEDMTTDEIRRLIDKWSRLLAWIKISPVVSNANTSPGAPNATK